MQTKKRWVITGATGLVGRPLCRTLQARGDEVVVLSRNPTQAKQTIPGAIDYLLWQPGEVPTVAVEGATGVIHLAGAPVFGERWSPEYKSQILRSRVEGTKGLVEAIRQAQSKVEVLVSASAIGYYGFRDDTALIETATPGTDFLAQVCVAWEAEAAQALVRTVQLRLGIVLDAQEGALAKMLPPFQNWVGGPLGSGKQWFSWVHREDVVGSIVFALDNPTLQGIYNCTAPQPQTMTDFCQTLGTVISRPSWAPVPRVALELLLGEGAIILVEGQRVLSTRLENAGYRFEYPNLAGALRQLLT